MINVNQITAKLATLPDQALQQYAMMNKNDPYIMSLAMSESTRRQEIRSAAQGAQGGMQQPPKVVDQVVAQMAPQPMPQQQLPEDVGIAQLPAGDMEMAGGGIVSFANGGWEEDLADLVEGGQPMSETSFGVDALNALGRALTYSSDKEKIKARELVKAKEKEESDKAKTKSSREKADAEIDRAEAAGESYPDVPAARPLYTPPPEVTTEAPEEAAPEAAPAAPSFVPGPTGINVNDTGLGALMSLDDYRKKYGMDVLDKEATGLEAQLKAAGQKEIEGKKKYLTDVKADIAELGKYGVEREAKLNKQLKELEGKEDKNVSMALLEAGLAMMSGTSQYAFENIGKGALVGTKAYKDGLEKIEAKRDILDERISNLLDIRRGEDRNNKEKVRAAELGVSEAESNLAKSLYTNTKDMLNMKRDTANVAATAHTNDQLARAKIRADKETADAQIRAGDRRTEAQLASAERIAAMPAAELQKLAALDPSGKGSIRAGYEEQQRIVAQYSSEGKFNLDKAYSEYLNKNEPTAALSGQKLLTKPEYAALFGQGVVNQLPKGGNVKPG